MIVNIVHRRTARKPDPGCSLLPDEDGLLSSDEMLPVEETIEAVHTDEPTAHKECAALNTTASDQQSKTYGEVLDEHTWTVTSMVVNKTAGDTDDSTGS